MVWDVHPKTRADGFVWPNFGEEADVPEEVASEAITVGWAVPADVPAGTPGFDALKEPWRAGDPAYNPEPEEEDEPEDFEGEPDDDGDDDFGDDFIDDDEVEDVDPVEEIREVKKPVTTDAKFKWVEYAISQGMDEDEANEMTKNKLVAKFRNS